MLKGNSLPKHVSLPTSSLLVSEILPEPSEGVAGSTVVADMMATTTLSLHAPPLMTVGEVSLDDRQEVAPAEAGTSLGLGASTPSQPEALSSLGLLKP